MRPLQELVDSKLDAIMDMIQPLVEKIPVGDIAHYRPIPHGSVSPRPGLPHRASFLRDEMLKPLNKAGVFVAELLGDWDRELKRKALAAQREAEEVARKAREAEIRAAAKDLRREGADKKDVASLREQMRAQPLPVAPVAVSQPPAGVSTIKRWNARIAGKTAAEQTVNFKRLLRAIAENPSLPATMVRVDQAALNRHAASTKGTVSTPGVEFFQTEHQRYK